MERSTSWTIGTTTKGLSSRPWTWTKRWSRSISPCLLSSHRSSRATKTCYRSSSWRGRGRLGTQVMRPQSILCTRDAQYTSQRSSSIPFGRRTPKPRKTSSDIATSIYSQGLRPMLRRVSDHRFDPIVIQLPSTPMPRYGVSFPDTPSRTGQGIIPRQPWSLI